MVYNETLLIFSRTSKRTIPMIRQAHALQIKLSTKHLVLGLLIRDSKCTKMFHLT